jgi:hypothetical protein
MKRTSRNPQQIIEGILAKLKQATWNDLKKETNLSKGALSKHLQLLIKYRRVEVNVDTSTTPKTLRYSLSPLSKLEEYKPRIDINEKDSVNQHEKDIRDLIGFSVQTGYVISLEKDRKQAWDLFERYAAFNLDSIVLEILCSIVCSYHYSRGYMRGKRKDDLDKQHEIFIKRLKEYSIRQFISPWIESLATSAFYNRDIIDTLWTCLKKRSEKVDMSVFSAVYNDKGSAPMRDRV